MNILVLNAGSSSIKYQVIEMPSQTVKCVGLVERIGFEDAIFTHEKNDEKYSEIVSILNHEIGLQRIAKTLLDAKIGVINETIFTSAKQIAIFDTAFHQTMPKEAYQYAIPNSFLDTHKIRAYGFHGTSHKYVSEKAIEYLG